MTIRLASSHASPPRARALGWLGVGWAVAYLLLGPSGCSTGAIAIQQCREIERLRCEGAAICGAMSESKVESCKRFYDDQCLHGIAGDEEPTADEQADCLAFLEDAEADAEAARDDEDRLDEYEEACSVVAEPWAYDECSFINRQISDGGSGSKDDDE